MAELPRLNGIIKALEEGQVAFVGSGLAGKLAVIRGLDLPLSEGIKLESQYVGLMLPRRKKRGT